MDKKNTLSRRGLLKIGGLSALALGANRVFGNGLSQICEETPVQPEGPFYPVRDQQDKNYDLTQVDGKSGTAQGTVIYLSGTVKDQECQPVQGMVVDIWQACKTGRYNHPGDSENSSWLDPNFQYWGIQKTDAAGKYHFKTIVPGHYNASPTWIRPPHIHFKLYKRGFHDLITQMYFANNQYNDGDLILRNVPTSERESVVRPMIPRTANGNPQEYDITFDINVIRIQ